MSSKNGESLQYGDDEPLSPSAIDWLLEVESSHFAPSMTSPSSHLQRQIEFGTPLSKEELSWILQVEASTFGSPASVQLSAPQRSIDFTLSATPTSPPAPTQQWAMTPSPTTPSPTMPPPGELPIGPFQGLLPSIAPYAQPVEQPAAATSVVPPVRRSSRVHAAIGDVVRSCRASGVYSDQDLQNLVLQQAPRQELGIPNVAGVVQGRGADLGEVVLAILAPGEPCPRGRDNIAQQPFCLFRTFGDLSGTSPICLDPMERTSSPRNEWVLKGAKSWFLMPSLLYPEPGYWLHDSRLAVLKYTPQRTYAAMVTSAEQERSEQAQQTESSQTSFAATQLP